MRAMKAPLSVAVGLSANGWHERFRAALDARAGCGRDFRYELVNLEAHDWLERVRPHDLVLWAADSMGALGAARMKERVYALEQHMGKLVVPNYRTVWHFESKIAQSYLFALEGVPTPVTVATADAADAERVLRASRLPLVFKRSEGAASKQVRLVRSLPEALRLGDRAFCGQLYHAARSGGGPRWRTLAKVGLRRWFREFLAHWALGREPAGGLYWQEFLPGNAADLRITVIGDRYAYGFWRKNRPGDFRASGSGRVDFETPVPEGPLRYCLELSRRLGFDSMAYDVLFRGEEFLITEMSYLYRDDVPRAAAGHHELFDDGRLAFRPGHVWPQALWVEWALRRAGAAGLGRGAHG